MASQDTTNTNTTVYTKMNLLIDTLEKMDTLALMNSVERDTKIEFIEYGHKYVIKTDKKSKYTSVTTWCHSHFPKFNADEVIQNIMNGKNWNPSNKYWNMTPEQIKKEWNMNASASATAGTKLHHDIELFMNNQVIKKGKDVGNETNTLVHSELLEFHLQNNSISKNTSIEWTYFTQFVTDHPNLKPYRTEWAIYDEELKLAGSVDMVYENPDGTLEIYDWKRTKEIVKSNGYGKYARTECVNHIPDCNFWHYALQLNTYKAILERNYGKTVRALYLVRIHPDNENNTYDLLNVPILNDDISKLFAFRKLYL